MIHMSIVQDLLADLPDTEVIPLPLIRQRIVQERIPWTRDAQALAVRQGTIHPVEKLGKAGCYQVTRDDAVMILVAAALALAAGVAVVIMLRAIQGAGLDAQALARAMT
jgi:hypothetical protein